MPPGMMSERMANRLSRGVAGLSLAEAAIVGLLASRAVLMSVATTVIAPSVGSDNCRSPSGQSRQGDSLALTLIEAALTAMIGAVPCQRTDARTAAASASTP